MKKPFVSYLFVIVQFTLIFYFLVFCKFFVFDFTLVFKISGFLLAAWAIYVMNKSVISAFPEPSDRATIIKNGPYHLIRHPMYLSLYLVFVPSVLILKTFSSSIILVIFILNQVLKMFYEEKLLKAKYVDYVDYMKESWRLIPYIF